MDTILKGLGYHDRHGRRAHDRRWPRIRRYQFAEGDKGRAEILAFIQERLTWIRAQLPRAFNTLVNPNMEVKRLPPEEEPGAPTAYGGAGSIDGKIPGRYWINLRTTDLHSKYSLADLTFHESIPGHILQGEFTRKMPLDPAAARVQRVFGRLGALCAAAGRRARRLRGRSGRAARLPAGDRVPRLPAGGRYRHSCQALDARAGRALLCRRQRLEPRWRSPARSIAIARGRDRRAATRLATARSTASARGRGRRSARSSTSRPSTTRLVLGGNVPLDVLAKNVDEYIRTAKA